MTPTADELAVVVEWIDTANVAAWQEPGELAEWAKDGGWVCRSVGWVAYEDDECVVLSARRADSGQWGLSERIPKSAIRAVSTSDVTFSTSAQCQCHAAARRTRRHVDRSLLEAVASVWAEGGESTEAVKKHFVVSERTAYRYVFLAREAGLIPEVPEGADDCALLRDDGSGAA